MNSLRWVLAAVICLLLMSAASAQQFKATGVSRPAPTFENGVWTMTIDRKNCSSRNYPGQNENDCEGGGRHSVIGTPGLGARLDQSWEYGFSFKIPEDFSYVPWEIKASHSAFTEDNRFLLMSRLNLAVWQRSMQKNVIYLLKLDSINGVTFQDAVCASPDDFGRWIDFKMTVRWGSKGYINVSCDDRVIYEKFVDHLFTPWCGQSRHCVEKYQKRGRNRPLEMQVGLWRESETYGITSIEPKGHTVQVKAPFARKIADVYKPKVKAVQQALLNAGHDPNGVDGAIGNGTRAALKSFQEASGLAASGEIDTPTLHRLALSEVAPAVVDEDVISPDQMPQMIAQQAKLRSLNPNELAQKHKLTAKLIAADYFKRPGGESTSMFVAAQLEDLPVNEGFFRFHLRFNNLGNFQTINIMVDRLLGLTPPKTSGDCRARPKIRDFDGHYYMTQLATKSADGKTWTVHHAPCTADIVPAIIDYNHRFLNGSLHLVAQALINNGDIRQVEDKNLVQLLQDVASQKVRIRWTGLGDQMNELGSAQVEGNPTEPGIQLLHLGVEHTQPLNQERGWVDANMQGYFLETFADGVVEIHEIFFALRGDFWAAVPTFTKIDVVAHHALSDDTRDALVKCAGDSTYTKLGNKFGPVVSFNIWNRKLSVRAAQCFEDHLQTPQSRFVFRLASTGMQKFAQDVIQSGNIKQFKRRGMAEWFQMVADGTFEFPVAE